MLFYWFDRKIGFLWFFARSEAREKVVIVSENIFYDAIVVGGGPGGSTAAAFLAMRGRKVLLLDKENFPRDKTCGDAISGKSRNVLRELGLWEAVEKSDHGLVSGITFSSPNGKSASIPFTASDGSSGSSYTCRRMVYDNLLWQNAKKLVDNYEGAQVVSAIRENGSGKICGVKARMKDGQEMEFHGKVVIGADGAGSVIAKEVRGAEVTPEHTCVAYRAYYSGVSGMNGNIEVHFVKSIMPGYFWIFPLENGLANVGIGMTMLDMKKNNVNLEKAMLDILANNPLFAERFKGAKLVSKINAWSLPLGSKRRTIHADNALLAGDAAGLVDPFSGEGIGNAMFSGRLAAQVAHEALAAGDTGEKFLSRYPERLWAAIGGELDISYKMQRLGRMHWLLDMVVGKAARSGKAREAIAGTFTNEEAKQGYASPLFYLKLLFS